ncbi:MAG TPA: hypothetical protein VF982_06575, partial [Anaerolineales bacterium]
GEREARIVLERLHEQGLIEGRGVKRGRYYMLAAPLYQRFQMEAEYVRARGFEPLQMEQMVLEYIHQHGKITRSEAADLCRLNQDQAYRLVRRLSVKHRQFQLRGSGRGAYYVWQENAR